MNIWSRIFKDGVFTEEDMKALSMTADGNELLKNDTESLGAAFWEWVDYGEQMGYDVSG